METEEQLRHEQCRKRMLFTAEYVQTASKLFGVVAEASWQQLQLKMSQLNMQGRAQQHHGSPACQQEHPTSQEHPLQAAKAGEEATGQGSHAISEPEINRLEQALQRGLQPFDCQSFAHSCAHAPSQAERDAMQQLNGQHGPWAQPYQRQRSIAQHAHLQARAVTAWLGIHKQPLCAL